MLITPKSMGELFRTTDTTSMVSAAYLHGSFAIGKADKDSDVDLAILAAPGLTPKERGALRLTLMSALSTALGDSAPELDLIILQDAPILLQYNVIRRGIRIYEANRGQRIEYELGVERTYDDECPMLNEESDMILERILSRPL